MISNKLLNGTPGGTDPLANLRLKAKESIMAKKAQALRPSSQDPITLGNSHNLAAFAENEARTQNLSAGMQNISPLHDSAFSRDGPNDSLSTEFSVPNTLTSRKAPAGISGKLQLQNDDSEAGNPLPVTHAEVKASSIEIEDLLAEGRAAAEKRPCNANAVNALPSHPEVRSDEVQSYGKQGTTKITTAPALCGRLYPTSAVRPHEISTKEDGEICTDDSSSKTTTPSKRVPAASCMKNRKNDNLSQPTISVTGAVRKNTRLTGSPQTKSDEDGASNEADSSTSQGKLPREGSQATPAEMDIVIGDADGQDQLRTQVTWWSEQSEKTLATIQTGTGSEDVYTLEDAEEWLLMTGFYDGPYRHKVLTRRRRIYAIEQEKKQLLLEEQAEQQQLNRLVRPQPILPHDIAPASPYLSRAASLVAMPPPSKGPYIDLGIKIRDLVSQNETDTDSVQGPKSPLNNNNVLKRRNSSTDKDFVEQEARKVMLTDSSIRANEEIDVEAPSMASAGSRQRYSTSTIAHRNPVPERFTHKTQSAVHRDRGLDRSTETVKLKYDERESDRPTVHSGYRRSPYENRTGLDRPTLCSTTAGSRRPTDDMGPDIRFNRYDRDRRGSTDAGHHFEKLEINLRVRDVRYFIIKSWNYENIETAQHECTWCTQTKNEELFVEAFKHSRHVILIFSANNSHAFQGYARMQCLPGDADVPDPSWKKNLHWPTTKPFRIRWIVKGDISYRVAGKLKNPLNDDTPVFVGRDGQEIPDRIGQELCEAIDDDAKYRAKSYSHGLNY